MNKLNPICDAPPHAGAAPSPAPLPVPLPQLRAHIQGLLDTHTDAPSLAAALRKVFRMEEGWFIPEPSEERSPVMLLFSLAPAGLMGPWMVTVTLERLATTGVWSLRTWSSEADDLLKVRPDPPIIGPHRAAGLAGLAITIHLSLALRGTGQEAARAGALVGALRALGLEAEILEAPQLALPSVLVAEWLLELCDGAWRGRRLGGAWAGPLDTVELATQWMHQLAQGEAFEGQGGRHAAS